MTQRYRDVVEQILAVCAENGEPVGAVDWDVEVPSAVTGTDSGWRTGCR